MKERATKKEGVVPEKDQPSRFPEDIQRVVDMVAEESVHIYYFYKKERMNYGTTS